MLGFATGLALGMPLDRLAQARGWSALKPPAPFGLGKRLDRAFVGAPEGRQEACQEPNRANNSPLCLKRDR